MAAAAAKWAAVAGTSKGIGLALTKALVGKGYNVVAACRSTSESLTEVQTASEGKVTVVEGVELAGDSGIAAFKAAISAAVGADGKLDLYVHNSGMLTFEKLDDVGSAAGTERMQTQLSLNAVAPLRFAAEIAPLVKDGGRITFVSSVMGSITVAGQGNVGTSNYGYCMSKAALNMGVALFAVDVKARSIAVATYHPGVVDTETAKDFDMEKITTDESAAGLTDRFEELTLDKTGAFLTYSGDALPW